MPVSQSTKLNTLLFSWKKQISRWSENGLLLSGAKEALKLGGKQAPLQSLLSKWAKGDFRELPTIRLVPATAINQANAGYAVGPKTIYINSSWLTTCNQAQFINVLTEELGHFLDHQLNIDDTQGDEGRYLSRYLEQSGNLSNSERESLRARQDHFIATIDNQSIAVETSTSTTTVKVGGVTFESDNLLPIPAKVGEHTLLPEETSDIIFKTTNKTTLYIQLTTPIPGTELLLTGGVDFMGYPLIPVDALNGRYKVENYQPVLGRSFFALIKKGEGNLIENCTVKAYAMDANSWASMKAPIMNTQRPKINGITYSRNQGDLVLYSAIWNFQGESSDTWSAVNPFSEITNTSYAKKQGFYSISTDYEETWKEFNPLYPEQLIFSGEGMHSLKIKAYDVAGNQTIFNENIFVDSTAPTTIISDLKITGEDGFARSIGSNALLRGSNYVLSGKLSKPLSPLTSTQSEEHLIIPEVTNIQWKNPTEFTATINIGEATYGKQIYAYIVDDAGNATPNTSITIRTQDPITGWYYTREVLDEDGFFKGTNESNTLQGNNGNDYIDGIDGNDKEYGGEGDDDLYGGDGKDMLYGEWGDDYLNGGEGSDKLYGGDNNDYLVGGGGNDTIDGGAGNDILIGGDGKDILIGGTGDDTYVLDDPFDLIDDQGLPSDKDTVIIRYQISSYVLTGGVKNADISGNSYVTSLTGSNDNNLLVGNNSGDVLSGLGGNDVIVSGSGNDIINGGAGFDVLDHSQTDQSISFNAISGKASGLSIGQDSVMGIEVVLAGSGDDILVGGVNRDVFYGGAGNDAIDGGTIGDLYIVNRGSEHTAAEFKDTGTSGIDELRFASTTDGDTLTLFSSDTGIEKIIIGTGYDLIADTKGKSQLNVDASGLRNLISLQGNDGDNTLTGTTFNDSIQGGDGNDQLIGGAGVDAIIGGGGNDMLNGGIGLDTLTGGLGSDRFIYEALTDALVGGTATARTFELIKDFSIGSDIFDAPGTSLRTTKNLGGVSTLVDAQLATVLSTSNFVANGAATFSQGSGSSLRTFVAINDATAGFNSANDAIIEITGYTGNLSNLIVT